MAFDISFDKNETIKVIVKGDTALKSTTSDAYDDYLRDLDEDHLNIEGEPTRFVLKKHLDAKDSQRIMNSQMKVKVGASSRPEPEVVLGYVIDEVQCAWVGMEGPGKEHFKLINGKAPSHLVSYLKEKEVIWDLYNARKNSIAGVEEGVPKNS